jgi:hypothetical protein
MHKGHGCVARGTSSIRNRSHRKISGSNVGLRALRPGPRHARTRLVGPVVDMAYMTACEMPDFFYSGTERIFCRKEIQGLRLFPLPGLPLFVRDAVWARENVISSQKHLTPWADWCCQGSDYPPCPMLIGEQLNGSFLDQGSSVYLIPLVHESVWRSFLP